MVHCENEARILEEIKKMGAFVEQARVEVAAIIAAKDSAGTDKNIGLISDELQEVVRHTEEATNSIMDHAEAIMQKGSEENPDSTVIANHAMSIIESCSFQDITGQRIKKVLQVVEQLEQRVDRIVDLLGGDIETDNIEVIASGNERADEAYMAGPQKADEAISQEDVDKLFS